MFALLSMSNGLANPVAGDTGTHHAIVRGASVLELVEQVVSGQPAPPPPRLSPSPEVLAGMREATEFRRRNLLAHLETDEWFSCAAKSAYYVHYIAQHRHVKGDSKPGARNDTDDNSAATSASQVAKELLLALPTPQSAVADRTIADVKCTLSAAELHGHFTTAQQERATAVAKPCEHMERVLKGLWLDQVELRNLHLKRNKLAEDFRTAQIKTETLLARGKQLHTDLQAKLMGLRRERLTMISQRQMAIGDEASLQDNIGEVVGLTQAASQGLNR
jgi:hypothetical protein